MVVVDVVVVVVEVVVVVVVVVVCSFGLAVVFVALWSLPKSSAFTTESASLIV